jgi:DNA-binding transcriptional regulator YdaS (Cro superfamily)
MTIRQPLESSSHDALRRAVELVGSQTAVARLLGVSQPSVWKWLSKEKPLPAEHVLAMEAATGISKHELRPDIYPATGGETLATSGSMEPAR